MTSPHAYAPLLAVYQRAVADAQHKEALIRTVAQKGPKAIAAAVATAAKAAKRRDAYAAQLAAVGVQLPADCGYAEANRSKSAQSLQKATQRYA